MAELYIDYKIDKIIKEIQDSISKKHGESLSYETIKEIIGQQFQSTAKAFEHGHSIIIKYYGTFVASRKRVDSLNNRHIKAGRTPTLVDNGLVRLAFKKDGEKIGEAPFDAQHRKDFVRQGDYKEKFK